MSKGHTVVLETLVGGCRGVKTWTMFPDEKAFQDFMGDTMQDGSGLRVRDVYRAVVEGVTPEEAERISSSRSNQIASMRAYLEETNKILP